ncbi:MAG TPA: ABC transporter permease [Acidobacteriota bacterium]|nr:ABC transporter permease [Acidobacteriota bacterium]
MSLQLGNKYLIRELVSRDLRSRYVGSYFGFLWSIVHPLVQLGVYTFVAFIFTRKADPNADPWQLGAVIFCGLMPWIAFQEALSRGATTYVENANLIKKLRFPMPLLPLKVVLTSFVHQIIGLGLFLVVLVLTGQLSVTHLPLLPVLILIQMMMTFGACLVAASLHVFVRDTVQALNLVLTVVFWATPIVYSRSIAPTGLGRLLSFNPLTHMVEAYRWTMLGGPPLSVGGLGYWTVCSIFLLGLGLLVFRRTRRELVDFI